MEKCDQLKTWELEGYETSNFTGNARIYNRFGRVGKIMNLIELKEADSARSLAQWLVKWADWKDGTHACDTPGPVV